MAHLTKKQKENRKSRPTWVGYFQRKTKTKKEKLESQEKKHKKNFCDFS